MNRTYDRIEAREAGELLISSYDLIKMLVQSDTSHNARFGRPVLLKYGDPAMKYDVKS